jgi:hypothetical protein
MNNIYEIEQELQRLIDDSIDRLRVQLQEQAADLLQNYTSHDQSEERFDSALADSRDVSLWNKSAKNIADIGTFAALSAVIPIPASAGRLPASLQSETLFRPALRRLGSLAGRSAATALFDTSNGTVSYSNRQAGQRLLQELFR